MENERASRLLVITTNRTLVSVEEISCIAEEMKTWFYKTNQQTEKLNFKIIIEKNPSILIYNNYEIVHDKKRSSKCTYLNQQIKLQPVPYLISLQCDGREKQKSRS